MKKYLIILLAVVMVMTFSFGTVFAGSYTVQSGDKLWEIAKDLNVSMDSLVNLNNIKDPNMIFTGQVLKPRTAAVRTSLQLMKPALPHRLHRLKNRNLR